MQFSAKHGIMEKTQKGRHPFDHVMMFKVLVLQRLFNLSDDQTEYAASKLDNTNSASKMTCRHMMTSQFRSGREKTRKREISRDFSRFFDPAFFRSFIDPFCPFRCYVRTRTHEKGFFASSRKQSVLWLDSDLRKRSRTVRKSLAFKKFYKATGCKKISD